jgi:hypothetical protein
MFYFSYISYTVAGIVAIVVGLLVCFLGYRLFRILLPLVGLVFGFALGELLLRPSGPWLLALVIGVAVGIIFAFLSWFFWSAAVIIGGAMLGLGFGWTVGTAYFVPGPIPAIIGAAFAVLFAILFAVLRKPAIMLSTAAGGGAAAVYGLGLLVPYFNLSHRPHVVATIVIIALAVAGFFVQYATNRAKNLYSDIGY